MHDIIRRRRGFVLQPRYVVVLDVIPFHAGNVEHIEGNEPLVRLLEANLSVDRGVLRRSCAPRSSGAASASKRARVNAAFNSAASQLLIW